MLGTSFSSRRRPLTAVKAGIRFLRNVDDTRHFFEFTDAIDGPQNEKNFQRYLKTPCGNRMATEQIDFADLLSDRERLAAYPAGTLAHEYLKFLDDEDISLEGLMGAEEEAQASTLGLDPVRRRFMTGGIALHDMLHVLTGYGREPVGEACVLAFTAEQLELAGMGSIARVLALREQVAHLNIPVISLFDEARARARSMSVWYPIVDWRDYLGVSLDETRERLGIGPARKYGRYYSVLKSSRPQKHPQGLREAA